MFEGLGNLATFLAARVGQDVVATESKGQRVFLAQLLGRAAINAASDRLIDLPIFHLSHDSVA
jgi:hypothetical protein